jgi:hypothetical protein
MTNKKIAGIVLILGGIVFVYYQVNKCNKKNADGSIPRFGVPRYLINTK